ncbi:MAG: hypothetical protein ACQEP5_03860 [Actinomycetota bacterium]
MLEETIGAYIDNIFKFIIFIGVSLLVFLALFLIAKKSRKSGRGIRFFKKDPLLLKNLFALGLIFVMLLLFVLLVSNIIVLIVEFQLGAPLYILIGFLFILLLISAYIVKSRILSREVK